MRTSISTYIEKSSWNIAHDLRGHFAHHKTYTAAYAGVAGLKNGKLLDAAEKKGFNVLVTGDKTLPYERNLGVRKIAVVCLSAVSWPVLNRLQSRLFVL